jgi:hypothetical protein
VGVVSLFGAVVLSLRAWSILLVLSWAASPGRSGGWVVLRGVLSVVCLYSLSVLCVLVSCCICKWLRW